MARLAVSDGVANTLVTIGGSLGGQIAASVVAGHIAASGLPEESGFTTAFAISAVGVGLALVAATAVPGRSAAAGADRSLAASRAAPQASEPR